MDIANTTVKEISRTSRRVESDGTIIINPEYETIINQTFSVSVNGVVICTLRKKKHVKFLTMQEI
jgi:hypothetical protein